MVYAAAVVLAAIILRSLVRVKELSDRFASLVGPRAGGALRASWLTPLLGRRIDRADHQWRSFRDAIPLLAGVAVGFVALSHGARALLRARGHAPGSPSFRRGRTRFYAAAGLAFLAVLHGADLAKVLLLGGAHRALTRALAGTRALVPCVWAFSVGVLFLNEWHGGYRWADVVAGAPLLGASARALGAARWADRQWGGLMGWHRTWNLVMLRLVSWSMDFHWAEQARRAPPPPPGPKDDATTKGAATTNADAAGDTPAAREKRRVRTPRPAGEYASAALLVAYVAYPPVYLSGPTQTFNSFAHHVGAPQREVGLRGKARFTAARLLLPLALLELFQHYVLTFFISKNLFARLAAKGADGAWGTPRPIIDLLFHFGSQPGDGGPPADLTGFMFFSYWALKMIWLKFLVIWRFARCWALWDDVRVPENMRRCMSNNTSVSGFWRGWHASFNRWLVRYIYVPLGGSRVSVPRRVLNVFVVFSFVAGWHDLTLQLLSWGWLFVAFVAVELLGARLPALVPPLGRALEASPALRLHAANLGGALNIMMLMGANLVGFSYSLSGMGALLGGLGQGGLAVVRSVGVNFAAYYCAVWVMQELRAGGGEDGNKDKQG